MIDRSRLMAMVAFLLFSPLFPALGQAAERGPLEAGLAAGTSYYDHRSGTGGPTSFHLRTLKPYARFDGAAGAWDLRVLAQRRYEFYSGDAIDTVLHTSRHTHDRATLRAERRFSRLDRLSVEGGYVRSHDLLEADQGTVVIDGGVTRWTGATAVRVDLFEGSGRIRTTSYGDEPELPGSRSVGWVARLVPLRRSIDSAFLGLADSQLDLGDTTVLLNRVASIGYRRRVLPLVTAEFEVGASETRFADGSRQRLPLFALAVERDPERGSALGLAMRAQFEGDSASALSAEARWRLASGRVWLRGESLADAEGGIYRSATLTRRIALGVEDTLGRANVLGFEGSYIRTRPLRAAGDGTEILRTTAWALRRIQPWLNARIAASYLREPIGLPKSGPVFRRIRLDAELIVLHGGFGTTIFKGPAGPRSGRAG